ncbi:MAG TPA: hypothetical protein VND23_00465 [Acidimicrobiales bacterium]|nr:hypothetical protein [Acidimicrobiales bacterium]
MPVRVDCRHYVMRTVASGDRVERCRLGAAAAVPFECPDGCLFFESRSTSSAGWQVSTRPDDGTPPGAPGRR